MGLYGNDYFIDNTMALEEALDNELNNFNLMMESFSNNIEVVNEGAIKDKIKELWEKFWNWFKSVIRTVSITFKYDTLNKLMKRAENSKNENCTPAILYRLNRDATDEYKAKSSDPDNIKEVKEGIYNFIKRNNEVISDINDLFKQFSQLPLSDNNNMLKLETSVNNINDILTKTGFKLIKVSTLQSKNLIIAAGNIYCDCFVKLDKQIETLNKHVKECDKWFKKFYSYWNITDLDEDDYSGPSSYYIKDLIPLLRDLTTKTFMMLKRSYNLATYYYLCALGKKKNDLKED